MRRQLSTCWTWLSIMNTTEVCPKPVLGPSSMKKFGNPATVTPRYASRFSGVSLRPSRPATLRLVTDSTTLKPVP